MRWLSGLVLAMGMVFPHGAMAQDDATLADIRQELTVLYVEVQRLKRELSTTGGAGSSVGTGDTFDRIAAIESELQRLTGKSEELEFRIGRVIEDGTNRIGDLEFR
ncbi:MAG: tol-pal system protein, partial [Pseudomonadota bacterium]